jgi:hypothetical protein
MKGKAMNRTSLMKALVGLAALATTAGSALAYPAAGNQIIPNASSATTGVKPFVTATSREFFSGRGRVRIDWPANGVLTAAAAITEIRLVGLNSAGVEISSVALNAAQVGAFVTTVAGGSPAGGQVLNLGATTDDEALTANPLVTTIGVTISNNASPTDANRIATFFHATDETQDSCLQVDATRPTLNNVFLQGGNLFFVFNKTLSLTGIGFGVAANETDTAMVDNTDFQYIASPGPFVFDATTSSSTGTLGAVTFVGGNNSILQIVLTTAGNIATGGQFRPDTTGSPEDNNSSIFDYLGNGALQTGGASVAAPPAFTITSIEWRTAFTGGTPNDAMAVGFSNPLSATIGNGAFYNNAGVGLMRGTVDSDLTIGGSPALDTTNPNIVLIDVTAGGDNVFADGRDDTGVQYNWNYSGSVGTQPVDIFGTTLAAPGAALTVNDGIDPAINAFAFGDFDNDGRLDTAYVIMTEPVTTTAGASNFTAVRTSATVQPFGQINQVTGELVNDDTVADANPANNNVPITGATIASIDQAAGGLPDRLNTNNAVCLAFNTNTVNWDNTSGNEGTATEAIPGTAGPLPLQVTTAGSSTVTDGNGNQINFPTLSSQTFTTDRANPIPAIAWFFTGDNQNGSSFDQFFCEQDGGVGDDEFNDRAGFAMSENINIGGLDEERVTYRSGQRNLNGANSTFVTANRFFIEDSNRISPDGIEVGDILVFQSDNGGEDGVGNPFSGSGTLIDCVAPYVPLDSTFGGNRFSVFFVDTNADGFADQINMRFQTAVIASTFQQADFTVTPGLVTGATLSADGLNAVLTLDTGTTNRVAMTSTVTLVYRGSIDTTRIARVGFPNNQVRAADQTVNNVGAVPQPNIDTQDLSIMPVRGIITDGTAVAPIGTRVEVMIAMPRAQRVTYVHNNIPHVIADYTNDFDGYYSLNAMTNHLLGLSPFVYLHRGVIEFNDTGDQANVQFLANCKDALGPDSADGESTEISSRDSVILSVAATSLNSVTFTGRGETAANGVTGGRVDMCWDVLRTDSGRLDDLYYTPEDGNQCDNDDSTGYAIYGDPIVSSAVIDNTSGIYEIHVSAPNSAFQGSGFNRLSAVNNPLIFVVTYPDGRRFITSSLTTTVNGGGPIVFNPNNRARQSTAGNPAPDTVSFNMNVANVGQRHVHEQWNIVPMDRASGYATSAANQPSPLPVGVVAANFAPVSSLTPTVGPLQQFVWFSDSNNDGVFTISDGGLDNIIIDVRQFVDFFAFTMNNQGVRVGNDINSLCGGQALGFFFNDYAIDTSIGMVQLGNPMNSASVFPASGTFFPNNTTTFGWALGTVTTNGGFATPAAFFTANPRADYIIIFQNTLDIDGRIRVFSQDADAADGVTDIDNVGAIADGTGMFIHYRSN